MGNYVNPDKLVSTDWVNEHKDDANIRLLEVDVDTSAYDQGHIQGALGVNWETQLNDQVRRDILTKSQFEELASSLGITPETTVVFYGDNNNWFAAYALWQFRYYQHPEDKLKIMNGGRKKWIQENRPLVKDVLSVKNSSYKAKFPDDNVRADKELIRQNINTNRINLVDVRSPAEFTGEVIAPAGMTETAQRGGHIPGAVDIPWASAVKDDGTFKSYDELKNIYRESDVSPERETIAYCRIGERSSHTWFVLKYLLGYDKVRNYDGSWTEWGNLVGYPIEKGNGSK